MKKLVMELIIRRVVHLVFGCIVLSSLVTFLYESEMMPRGKESFLAGLCVGVVLYIAFNLKMMRKVYFFVEEKRWCYVINFSAYFVFGLINMLAYIICSNYAFAWLFAITKFIRYTNLGMTRPASICVFHLIMAIAILTAPIGLGWIKEKRRERHEFISRMPGRLEVNPLENVAANDKEEAQDEIQKETEENTLS